MSVIYIALPVALMMGFGAVAAFVWAANRGQYDDLDTPAIRILNDDEEVHRDDPGDSTSSDSTSS